MRKVLILTVFFLLYQFNSLAAYEPERDGQIVIYGFSPTNNIFVYAHDGYQDTTVGKQYFKISIFDIESNKEIYSQTGHDSTKYEAGFYSVSNPLQADLLETEFHYYPLQEIYHYLVSNNIALQNTTKDWQNLYIKNRIGHGVSSQNCYELFLSKRESGSKKSAYKLNIEQTDKVLKILIFNNSDKKIERTIYKPKYTWYLPYKIYINEKDKLALIIFGIDNTGEGFSHYCDFSYLSYEAYAFSY